MYNSQIISKALYIVYQIMYVFNVCIDSGDTDDLEEAITVNQVNDTCFWNIYMYQITYLTAYI